MAKLPRPPRDKIPVAGLLRQAVARYQSGELEEARVRCEQVLAVAPGNLIALELSGAIAVLAGQFGKGADLLSRALKVDPSRGATRANLGFALHELKQFDAALAVLDAAVRLEPGNAAAHNNRGRTLHALDRYEEALESYAKAIELKPDFAEAFNNRASTLSRLKRTQHAILDYEKAVELKPGYPQANLSLAACRLALGDFERGWPAYEWRWTHRDAGRPDRTRPLWLGKEPLAGKTILLYSEQGLGDTLQFCRYATLVAERGARVLLAVQPPLVALLKGLDGVSEVFAKGSPVPDYDFQCPLLSLPLAFRTRIDTLPAPRAYLHADEASVRAWRAKLGPRSRPRVGLAWSGSPKNENDPGRSIPLRLFAPLMRLPVDFHGLQKEIRPEDRTAAAGFGTLTLHEEDFVNTAALAHEMDLVISVCSSIAHLAGALGKPVWVLLPHVPDWRWMFDREDSPWYPTAQLYRQAARGDWDGVIARVGQALRDLR